MITIESAEALGMIEGTEFATRQIYAIDAAVRMLTDDARDVALSRMVATWSEKQNEELAKRRLELVERGAGLDILTAYEVARWLAFSARMRAQTELLEIETKKIIPLLPANFGEAMQ